MRDGRRWDRRKRDKGSVQEGIRLGQEKVNGADTDPKEEIKKSRSVIC